MVSLLLLAMALSAPLSTAQTAVVPDEPLVVERAPLVFMHHGVPQQMIEEQQTQSFDAMEIRPDTDICYKIRAYVFSKGPVPELLRETTCGPKRAAAKSVEGVRPRLVPRDDGEKSTAVPER